MINLACGVIRISNKCYCLDIFDQQGNPSFTLLLVISISFSIIALGSRSDICFLYIYIYIYIYSAWVEGSYSITKIYKKGLHSFYSLIHVDIFYKVLDRDLINTLFFYG